MTQLAEILETAGDTVMEVKFLKKPKEEDVAEKLRVLSPAQLKNPKYAA